MTLVLVAQPHVDGPLSHPPLHEAQRLVSGRKGNASSIAKSSHLPGGNITASKHSFFCLPDRRFPCPIPHQPESDVVNLSFSPCSCTSKARVIDRSAGSMPSDMHSPPVAPRPTGIRQRWTMRDCLWAPMLGTVGRQRGALGCVQCTRHITGCTAIVFDLRAHTLYKLPLAPDQWKTRMVCWFCDVSGAIGDIVGPGMRTG